MMKIELDIDGDDVPDVIAEVDLKVLKKLFVLKVLTLAGLGSLSAYFMI